MKREVDRSHLDKVFWKKEGYTKGDVIRYYHDIAKTILPHLKNRPMVLNRHPNGIDGESFFQKQIDLAHAPAWLEHVEVEHTQRNVNYLLVQNVESLIYAANLGCIELNPFHASVPHLDKPDYMVIDLDPDRIAFERIVEVALATHSLLDEIGMDNYCKTSGGRGLHIYVPLGAKYTFEESRECARLIGMILQTRFPKLVSLEHSKELRKKRIYFDYVRNGSKQTVAAPYCIRPRPKAPVSMPLDWKEVNENLDPFDFTIETAPARIAKVGDLFKPVLGKGIALHRCLKALHKFLS